MRGPTPAFAACWGPRHGRPRRWRGSPGPRSQPLARPPRSLLRLRQPSAMRQVPAPGLPPVSAACRGPRSGPRQGSLGLQTPLPARLGPLLGRNDRACCLDGGGGHLGWLRLPGRRRRPDQHRRVRQPPLLALRRVSPVPSGCSAWEFWVLCLLSLWSPCLCVCVCVRSFGVPPCSAPLLWGIFWGWVGEGSGWGACGCSQFLRLSFGLPSKASLTPSWL